MVLKSPVSEKLRSFFVKGEFPVKPESRFVSIVVLRKSESELILRTDEGISKELTYMGFVDKNIKTRVVFSKRKVVAPERRTGREFLRFYGLFDVDCSINGQMCGKCVDCQLYGFAAAEKGGTSKGSLKSRVLSDTAYSILPASEITEILTINALSELGTMTEVTEQGLEMRESLASVECVKPETHFVDVETLRDVREEEFVYCLGNILRTTRYGAVTSRIGKVKNEIVAIIGSDAELLSSLQLTKAVWDKLDAPVKQHPLPHDKVKEALLECVEESLKDAPATVQILKERELEDLLKEIREIYANPVEKGFVDALKNLKKLPIDAEAR